MSSSQIKAPPLHFFSLEELKGWTSERVRKSFGGKAAGLFDAYRLDLPLPQTWFLGIEHYEAFLHFHVRQSKETFKAAATKWLLSQFSGFFTALTDTLFAVRSSSQFEDAQEQSFAGIFASHLNISKQHLAEAIASVWDSCFSLRAATYVPEKGDLRMGVILQPMIKAKYAGVAFSKHPSPSNVYENQNVVIEFAHSPGEKIVQGEITPLRLSGSFEQLLSSTDAPWMPSLLSVMAKIKETFRHEIDIEFVVDDRENFWLVQQRPISRLHTSHLLDLNFYHRKFKRKLLGFDVELLIEGCNRYLAGYLEIPYQLERWMVMITGKDMVQELWVHTLLDQAIAYKISLKIEEDSLYLDRIRDRYSYFYHKILSYPYEVFAESSIPLEKRFFNFCEFILPLEAHYYVPFFLIDALHLLLKKQMSAIDPLNAEADLFQLGTWNIASLTDVFYDELRTLKKELDSVPSDYVKLPSSIQEVCQTLSERYGFLKCRQIDERPYSPREVFDLLKELSPKQPLSSAAYDSLVQKYFPHHSDLLEKFRTWMKIRNQEMEFLMYSFMKSRPLFEEIAHFLGLSLKEVWSGSREMIAHAIQQKAPWILHHFDNRNLAIFRSYGKTRLLTHLEIGHPKPVTKGGLKGKKVYGSGKMQAKVKIAFQPKDLDGFVAKEPTVLVTGMTTPDFIPYLRNNFCALVTDEGGILCHAAIVAREIPIPCIVGTGIATTALSNGKSIQMDFDQGEIYFS